MLFFSDKSSGPEGELLHYSYPKKRGPQHTFSFRLHIKRLIPPV